MSDRVVKLIDTVGNVHTLACSDEAYKMATSPGLWGKAPVTVGSRPVANIDGERLTQTRRGARLIPLPLWVTADTEEELDTRLGELGRMFDVGEDIRLVFKRPDGIEREITVRYYSGAAAIPVKHHQFHSVRVPCVFKALDPDWRGTNETTSVVSEQFQDARLGGLNGLYLGNVGDLDTWPEWKITGPAENIQALNLNTGELWRSPEILTAGQVLRIRTDPRDRGVWLDDVLNWGIIEATSTLWRLVPGINIIDVRAAGDTSGNIGDLSIQWLSRHDTC